MGDKRQWARSTNGPDEVDVVTMMRALQALHTGHAAVTFSPSGTGSDTGVTITAGMIFEKLPGSQLPGGVTASVDWPNKENASFWGAVYNSLWILDHEISKVYSQESLWK